MAGADLSRIEIQAHRGASTEAPENTMAAFKRAVEIGADYIEFDVRRTAEGRGVIIHDSTVNRVTNGRGKVESMSEDALKELDAGSWFSPRFKGERLPMLDEILELAAGCSIKLNIEIKSHELEEFVIRRVRAHDMLERSVISSFSMRCLAKVREIEPEMKIAPLFVVLFRLSKVLKRLKPQYLNLAASPFLTKNFIARAADGGAKINVWTVNTLQQLIRYGEMGVNGVITNESALMRNEALNQDSSTKI